VKPVPDYDPAFYDDLAATYDRMYEDWWGGSVALAGALAALLDADGVRPPSAILDCTCGIGTQSLPLAARGYRMTGSDLSGPSVERARREAADQVERTFDAAISYDNSLPHLLTDEDLILALSSIRRCLRPGGLFLATIPDYDRILREDVHGVVPEIRGEGDGRSIIGQAWEWADDRRTLALNHILLIKRQDDPGWDAAVRTTTYRALRRAEFDSALAVSGFGDVRWVFPAESRFYQPVVLARALP
jgi:glycine/sarcosine N-methyltransferase